MNDSELHQTLDVLRGLPHETEWVEFKEANNQFDFDKLGRYFSALSNEANLKRRPCGWVVFGVVNSDRSICGSRFRENPADLDHLKHQVAEQTSGNLTFLDIHVVNRPEGRVVMFQIPPAPPGIPTAWKGHFYGRNGESIGALSLHELETIRGQIAGSDWSAGICAAANLDDLDPYAIMIARANFRAKNQDKPFANEIDKWPLARFLDRAKITTGGRVTRAAILLLGKPESVVHLQPAVAQLTWRLEGEERAYEHFAPPFLLTTNALYGRIRNTLQKVELPSQLVPLEVPKYEKGVLMEALHNAIAHQDYTLNSRVIVTERLDYLQIESVGRFFEGDVVDYTLGEKTPSRYRNRFLADAMVNVNMIDTMGYGIRRMFHEQRKRFYPLPDFDTSDPDRVVVTIHGKVIDPNYTAALVEHQDLPLQTVILLDQVQKKQQVKKEDADFLKRKKLAEGRYPNLFVAAHVAFATDDKAQYIKNRAFDDAHYKQMIVEYLKKYGHASRGEVDALLLDKLSDVLDEKQKVNKVRNILYAMSRDKIIRGQRSGRTSKWELNLDEKPKKLGS